MTMSSAHQTGKQEEKRDNIPPKSGAVKIPKKTLKQYKEIEEELEKIRRETDSQDTRLLKIQNSSRHVEDDYQNKKKEVENKLTELARRKQLFAEKQKKAKEVLNQEEERVRKFENKKVQEKAKLEENEKKIEELKKERDEKEAYKQMKKEEKQKLENEVNELKKYESFLKEVMKQSPEFFDEAEGQEGFNVQNLIAKHARIKKNKEKFEEDLEKIDRMKEEETEKFQKFKKEQEELILMDTSRLYLLQEQIEQLNKEKSKAQSDINRIELRSNLETAKWSQIIMSIANLCNRAQEAKDFREMEKRKEKEREQHVESTEEKPDKLEKKKKDLRKWDEIRTEDLLENLAYVEEQIKFLRDVKSGFEKEKQKQKTTGK